jgi:hypothetical protein
MTRGDGNVDRRTKGTEETFSHFDSNPVRRSIPLIALQPRFSTVPAKVHLP